MPAARYWRIAGITTYGGDLELSEIALLDASGRIDGTATVTSAFAPASGSLSNLSDGSTASVARFAAGDVSSPGFYVQYDFGAGSAPTVTGLRFGSGTDASRFVEMVDVFYSSAAAGPWVKWQPLGRVLWPGASTLSQDVAAGDAWLSRVQLLLPFDGADGSAIGDLSSPTKTIQVVGAAAISTSKSKFGGSSLNLPGSGSYIYTPASSALVFGVRDFTIEGWINTTQTGERAIVENYNSTVATWQLLMRSNVLTWYTGSYLASGTTPLNDGNWHHFAASRVDGTLRLFVDGVEEASVALPNNFSAAAAIALGAQHTVVNRAYDLIGNLDDVRISVGFGRYAGTFSPPATANPTTSNEAVADYRTRTTGTAVLRAYATSQNNGVPTSIVGLMARARDIYLDGRGRIAGTVKRDADPSDVPLKRRVRIHNERSGLFVRETWSDPITGAYEFLSIDEREVYTVITYDYEHNYRAVVADNIVPELMP